MKIVLSILFMFSALLASGGDTLTFSNEVNTLADGDTFYADKHWGSLRDTLSNVINGRLGNVNLAADANIDASKFDITKTAKFDSLKLTRGISATKGNFSSTLSALSGSFGSTVVGSPIQSASYVSAATHMQAGTDITAGGKLVAGTVAYCDSISFSEGSDHFFYSNNGAGAYCTLTALSNCSLATGYRDTIGVFHFERIGKTISAHINAINVRFVATNTSADFRIKGIPSTAMPNDTITVAIPAGSYGKSCNLTIGTLITSQNTLANLVAPTAGDVYIYKNMTFTYSKW